MQNNDLISRTEAISLLRKEAERDRSSTYSIHECDVIGYAIRRNMELLKDMPDAMQALSPHPDGDASILACPHCGSGEYLHNEDGNQNCFCGQCGHAIDWDHH